MPIYVYRCPKCGNQFDKLQSFNADSIYPCPTCKAEARRVLQPAGIVFKGSGWYITDSRKEDADRAAKAAAKPSRTDNPAVESSTASPAAENGATGAASESSPANNNNATESSTSTKEKESSKPAETVTANPA